MEAFLCWGILGYTLDLFCRIDANYVFLNEAKRINTALDSLNATGKYLEVTDGKAFAKVNIAFLWLKC